MKKTPLVALVALAVLAAVACQNSPTASKLGATEKPKSTKTVINTADLVGTWQATKAVGQSDLKPGVVRDLVAEGGTVTLVLEPCQEGLDPAKSPAYWPRYTITVAMPGANPAVDTGRYVYSQHSIETGYSPHPQIDFYPDSLGPDAEYGWIPAFLVSLSGNTLNLWDSGLTFLPYDFGWGTVPGMNGTRLTLEFTRR